MERSSYDKVRGEVRPGDVIAFLGNSALSKLAQAGTDVSHAGIIVAAAGERGPEPTFLEATVRLFGKDATTRAMESSFKDRCEGYDGEVWWLPMAPDVRKRFDKGAFVRFVSGAIGTRFDLAEGVLTALREWWDQLFGASDAPPVVEEAFFCSELVAEALQRARVVSLQDASLIHPADLCTWRIYTDAYFRLKGKGKGIPEYNKRAPGSFLRDGTR